MGARLDHVERAVRQLNEAVPTFASHPFETGFEHGGRDDPRGNAQLARVEQIKYFHIVGGEWFPGTDELTPTMKPRRSVIAKKYAKEIDAMYANARET